MDLSWLKELVVGAIGGALSGLAVNIHLRKSDKKELRRVHLEMTKIKIEEYKRRSETITIDRLNQTPLNDEKTQETIKKLQEILVDIKKDLIHCPKAIRKNVLSFHDLCKAKDQKLLIAMLQFKQNGNSNIDIVDEVNKIDRAYSTLIREIDSFL